MNIALSALQQRDYLTGVGRYIAELIARIPACAPDWTFSLYMKRNQVDLFPVAAPNFRPVVLDSCPLPPAKRALWEFFRFPNRLRADAPDLYHGPANFLPPVKVCPYVLTLHDMVYFRNPGRTNPLKSTYWRTYIRRTWKHADLIVTDSEFSREEIVRFLGVPRDRVRVVLIGVDNRFFEAAGDEVREEMRRELHIDRPYVLYVGRLDPDKNVGRLIEAFACLRESGLSDCLLVLAGAKDYRSSGLEDLVRKRDLVDHVRFAGYVKETHLTAVYQEAAAFCYPSLNEGFGLPPLEALAAGVPVVTSNLSSLPEVVADAGIQVDPYSVEAIAEGLRRALEPSRRAEFREKGQARARVLSWDNAARQLVGVYREVLKA